MNNKDLVAVFTAARKRIARRASYFSYICWVIEDTRFSDAKVNHARQIIVDRLDGARSCEAWLVQNGQHGSTNYLTSNAEGREMMREYRLRWLDSLIAEFS